jgi:membrane protein implicated in regulation of membrane protease activity
MNKESAMELLYWHWIIMGILLVLFELIIPSFTAMWFGLGAVFVGALLWCYPDMAGALQVLIWAVTSALLTFFWFRVFKPKKGGHLPSRDQVEGEWGLVILPSSEHKPGVIRFATPLLDEDEWPFRSEQTLEAGEQARVVDVKENVLIVTRRH